MRNVIAMAMLLALNAAAPAAVDPGAAIIPRLEYEPLKPGSYQLQRIQTAPDALLLDVDGGVAHLKDAIHGKVTLLTFFYTYCVDPLGCPYAYAALTQLREDLLSDRRLAANTRFVSVSFDPSNDTPQAIASYGAEFGGDERFEWRFFTARSVAELLPLLDDLGQDVSVQTDARGHATRTLHHMLKLFLIDRAGVVREIYTLAYLQPRVIFNDIQTLLTEHHPASSRSNLHASLKGR
jgi:protein SCO1/2